jgi:hypothetical protein
MPCHAEASANRFVAGLPLTRQDDACPLGQRRRQASRTREDLILTMRAEASALLLPWTFDPSEVAALALSFPGKTADYTAVGLSIIAWGPPGNPAQEWSREVPKALINVLIENAEEFAATLSLIEANHDLCIELGRQALRAGEKYFSPDTAARVFETGLLKRDLARNQ